MNRFSNISFRMLDGENLCEVTATVDGEQFTFTAPDKVAIAILHTSRSSKNATAAQSIEPYDCTKTDANSDGEFSHAALCPCFDRGWEAGLRRGRSQAKYAAPHMEAQTRKI